MPALRILHVINDLSPGGAERLVLELCRECGPDFASSVATVGGLGGLAEAFRVAEVPVNSAGRPRKSIGAHALFRLAGWVRQADVVHTHLFAGDTWGRAAAMFARHPAVVTTEHNVDRDEGWERHARRALAPKTKITIAVSEAVARHSFGRDIRVIPNGVQLARFNHPHRGGRGVLAVGRRVPQKGFDVLLRACDELQNVRVRIAGEGPYAPPHPSVEWLGRREDIPTLLAESDVFVAPSRWEGFGLAALEAMAAGVPVVASNVDGLSDLVGSAGLLVAPGDADGLAKAVRTILDDSALAAELSSRGKARASQFGLERMVESYRAVWREAAGTMAA